MAARNCGRRWRCAGTWTWPATTGRSRRKMYSDRSGRRSHRRAAARQGPPRRGEWPPVTSHSAAPQFGVKALQHPSGGLVDWHLTKAGGSPRDVTAVALARAVLMLRGPHPLLEGIAEVHQGGVDRCLFTCVRKSASLASAFCAPSCRYPGWRWRGRRPGRSPDPCQRTAGLANELPRCSLADVRGHLAISAGRTVDLTHRHTNHTVLVEGPEIAIGLVGRRRVVKRHE